MILIIIIIMVPFPKDHLTSQRLLILDYVKGRNDHPTASDIFEGVRVVFPRISLGTVYRTLDLLQRLGFIRVITTSGGYRRYDGDTSDHLHVICIRCGRAVDLPLAASQIIKTDINLPRNYDILGYDVVVRAICPRCAAKAGGMT